MCWSYQPSTQLLWPLQAPNCWFQCIFSGIQPPPTPSSDEYNQPRNLGSPMTNPFAVVGSHAASFSSVLQSWNVYFAAEKSFHQTICGFTCKILLIGVIYVFPLFGLLLLHVGFIQLFFRFVWMASFWSCAQSCADPRQLHFVYPGPVWCTVFCHKPSNIAPLFLLPTVLRLTPTSSHIYRILTVVPWHLPG